jgi:hypothetical protein
MSVRHDSVSSVLWNTLCCELHKCFRYIFAGVLCGTIAFGYCHVHDCLILFRCVAPRYILCWQVQRRRVFVYRGAEELRRAETKSLPSTHGAVGSCGGAVGSSQPSGSANVDIVF